MKGEIDRNIESKCVWKEEFDRCSWLINVQTVKVEIFGLMFPCCLFYKLCGNQVNVSFLVFSVSRISRSKKHNMCVLKLYIKFIQKIITVLHFYERFECECLNIIMFSTQFFCLID